MENNDGHDAGLNEASQQPKGEGPFQVALNAPFQLVNKQSSCLIAGGHHVMVVIGAIISWFMSDSSTVSTNVQHAGNVLSPADPRLPKTSDCTL